MKIFGKWGYFWYRNMNKHIQEERHQWERLKRHYYLLELHSQLRNIRYGRKIRLQCMAKIARCDMLEEYLRIRKQQQKKNESWHKLI